MMRRRRRRRAQWLYADSTNMSINSGSVVLAGQPVAFIWLLPPGRCQFLMDTKGRDRMLFAGAHIWMDFQWANIGSASGLPDIDLSIFKTTISDPVGSFPDLSPLTGMWDQPSTPNSLSTWEDDDDDGTNSFLWSHHIKGTLPPNSYVWQFGSGSSGIQTTNQGIPQIAAGTIDAPTFSCRKFHVTQEWQPDVTVRVKRRLQKGEGIVMGMTSPAVISSTVQCRLGVQLRTLGVV